MEPETTTIERKNSKPVWGYVLAVVLVIALVIFFYFWSQRQVEPALEAPVYTEVEREELLNSLRAPSVAEMSIEERNAAMQSLRAPSESEISVAQREQILDSLKAR